MHEMLDIAALLIALPGLVLMAAGLAALFRRRPLRFALETLAGLLLVTAGALLGTLGVATRGYQALTREEVAAWVTVRPTAPRRFDARLRFPDGRETSFALAGDQIYVDAHILKWKPVANFIGLHTAYELDRVSGRYLELSRERSDPRTVFSLSRGKPVDMFHLRSRYAFLAPLLDVEYGSAAYALADRAAEFEVRVSASGLLIREQR